MNKYRVWVPAPVGALHMLFWPPSLPSSFSHLSHQPCEGVRDNMKEKKLKSFLWTNKHKLCQPWKFKGGIGSLFDPVLTLWDGGHIGLSRMEQSYCTSGFFRQCVTARNHSNYQPRPKRRSIIAYGKRKNVRRDKVRRSGRICFIFQLFQLDTFYTFQTFPGKAHLFSQFFPLFSVLWLICPIPKCIWSIWRYVFCIGPTVSFYLLITF